LGKNITEIQDSQGMFDWMWNLADCMPFCYGYFIKGAKTSFEITSSHEKEMYDQFQIDIKTERKVVF